MGLMGNANYEQNTSKLRAKRYLSSKWNCRNFAVSEVHNDTNA